MNGYKWLQIASKDATHHICPYPYVPVVFSFETDKHDNMWLNWHACHICGFTKVNLENRLSQDSKLARESDCRERVASDTVSDWLVLLSLVKRNWRIFLSTVPGKALLSYVWMFSIRVISLSKELFSSSELRPPWLSMSDKLRSDMRITVEDMEGDTVRLNTAIEKLWPWRWSASHPGSLRLSSCNLAKSPRRSPMASKPSRVVVFFNCEVRRSNSSRSLLWPYLPRYARIIVTIWKTIILDNDGVLLENQQGANYQYIKY